MYIVDGIAYAGEPVPDLKISGVRPKDGLMLWVRFNTGEARLLDCSPLVDSAAFAPLRDPQIFRDVYIDYGIPVWDEGNIDLSPEYIYKNSVPAQEVAN